MGNLEALKALYVKLGGSATDVAGMTTLSEVIAATSALEIGGGSGIPDLFLITITYDGDDPVSDKTYAEIAAAVTAGKIIAIRDGNAFGFTTMAPVSGVYVGALSRFVAADVGVVAVMSYTVSFAESGVTVSDPSVYPLVTEP